MREVLSALTRQTRPLLSFEDVRRKLKAVEGANRVLTEVPLDRIVGSVGRYNDFTREFLPRQDSDRERWAGVQMAMTGLSGIPPIELYRIGDAYFVKDGNHRVSVARQLGNRFIQAYVTPLHSRVHVGPDVSPDELIIKAEQTAFLEETAIDELKGGSDLSVTAPGQYGVLLEHINVHRYFMGIDEQRDISFEEAVVHWYETVYEPVVQLIEHNDLLAGFEGRTVTDLYLFLSEHRGRLWRELGFRLPTGAVAADMARRSLRSSPAARARLLERARASEAPGLYGDILVGLTGEADEVVFEQSLLLAQAEQAELYVLRSEHTDAAELEQKAAAASVGAQFVVISGNPVDALLDRSQFSELIVLPRGRNLNSLVRRIRRPVLAVTGEVLRLRHLLLAFDGGQRSEEAMFHAAYLQLTRRAQLTVVTVQGSAAAGQRVLDKARAYLQGAGVAAEYETVRGPVVAALLEAADTRGCDLIVLGSYKYSAWLETVLGGVPDELISQARQNLLIV